MFITGCLMVVTPSSPPLPTGTAYRRGLCVRCQQVPAAAGMTRCRPCHSDVTGTSLTDLERREALIRAMAGTRPSLAVLAVAIAVADVLLAATTDMARTGGAR